jgi:chemotaxis signal transduction protein
MSQSTHFANLVMHDLNLMIPQADIYSLEPITDMSPNHDSTAVLGFVQLQQQAIPVYALSAELQPLQQKPANYRIIVLMKNVDHTYGLLCEQIYAIKAEQIRLHSLPSVMRHAHTVLTHLAHYQEQVHCVSSAQLLSHLFAMHFKGQMT